MFARPHATTGKLLIGFFYILYWRASVNCIDTLQFGYTQTFTVGTLHEAQHGFLCLSPAQLSEQTGNKVCAVTTNTHFIPSIISRCGSTVLRQNCSELSWNVFHLISYSQQETVFSECIHHSFTFHIDHHVPYVSWYRHSDGVWRMKSFGHVSRRVVVSLVPYFSEGNNVKWGTRWRSWLRNCATSRKVAGSIPRWCHWNFSLT